MVETVIGNIIFKNVEWLDNGNVVGIEWVDGY